MYVGRKIKELKELKQLKHSNELYAHKLHM